ncbi:DUF2846 domain-containing protein [Flavisphingomonas formosensis]|uniref:DUF2846 domain-containing protein n=1 Tax=Flavisphingomonas formosensis TaxID=861534 RepID=UPI0012FA3796|nr:DUF2846 domain-containing protein [Sphingomonas formosensis]
MIVHKSAIVAAFGLACAMAGGTALAEPATDSAPAAGAPVVIPPPPAGMSQVVFFRPSAMGMAISCNIRENGKMLGTTNNGRYWVLTTTPGAHKFTTKSEATDELNMEAEADETSYVKCKIGMGIVAGRPNLSPSTKEEFDGKSAKMKPSDPEKMAKTIAEDDAKRAAPAAQ